MKGFAFASLLTACLVSTDPVMAEENETDAPEMNLNYEVYVGGFHAIDGSMALSLNEEGYSSKLEARARGVMSLFTDFQLDTRAAGVSYPEGPRPQRFDSLTDKGDKSRRVVVLYGDDGTVNAEIDPPSKKDQKYPIPQYMRRDTLDPLSTVLALGWSQLAEDGCQEDLEVFDGRRRFDLRVENRGWTSVERSKYQAFEGETLVCALTLTKRIHGPQREKESGYPDEAVIYLARLAQGWPLVPVRLEMDLEIGSLRGHLSNYELPMGATEQAEAGQ